MNRGMQLCATAAIVAVMVTANQAEAQTIVVEGQAQVQPYGQPQGTVQAPAGYGVQAQIYVQPAPAYAPQYAPTYAQRQRQVRYEDRETTIKGLWIPGIIVFGVSFGLTGAFSSAISFNEDYTLWSWVPLVGPWVALSYSTTDEETTGSLVGGIAQAAGLTMFVLGLSLHRTVRVATYTLDDGERSPTLAFEMLPTVGGARAGLTLSHF